VVAEVVVAEAEVMGDAEADADGVAGADVAADADGALTATEVAPMRAAVTRTATTTLVTTGRVGIAGCTVTASLDPGDEANDLLHSYFTSSERVV
jgi:hypothetical protein